MPDTAKDDTLEATLLKLATPNISPKDLLREARKLHPKATKKDIIRAALSSMIHTADQDVEKSQALQNFAFAERSEPTPE